MANKQISITLEQHRHTETIQHHRGLTEGYTTEEKETHTDYKIVKMVNAAIIEWDDRKLRVGDFVNEQEADVMARCQRFTVTVNV